MAMEFDVAAIAKRFVASNLTAIWKVSTLTAKSVANTAKPRFATTYRTYIKRVLERYGRGKSFFVRSEATPLYQFFVPLDLSNSKRKIVQADIRKLTSASSFSIIVGSGGTGKSMMMRHLLINCIEEKYKTPIFL